jgi:tripartite-type tricarboxylate transporter receptor subunit TctC
LAATDARRFGALWLWRRIAAERSGATVISRRLGLALLGYSLLLGRHNDPPLTSPDEWATLLLRNFGRALKERRISMKLPRPRSLHLAARAAALSGIFVAAIALTDHGAQSQTAKIIKTVVPYAAGGANDIVARLLAEQIGRIGGPTLVIENHPGAGGVIGTEDVARAAPDGNTLLIASTPFAIDPQLRKVKYDPLTSFEPVCHLVDAPTVIVVNGASPYRTLAELLEAARVKPGQLTLASIGPGSSFQLGFEMLKRDAKVDMTFVPYPGNAPALSAVLGDHVTSMFGTYTNVAEYLTTGKLRALAVASEARVEALPNVPTVSEAGYKDFEADAWFGAFAPAKTPKEVISRIGGAFIAALQAPDVKGKLLAQGLYPVGICGADFANYIRKQYDEYGRIIREANMKLD